MDGRGLGNYATLILAFHVRAAFLITQHATLIVMETKHAVRVDFGKPVIAFRTLAEECSRRVIASVPSTPIARSELISAILLGVSAQRVILVYI